MILYLSKSGRSYMYFMHLLIPLKLKIVNTLFQPLLLNMLLVRPKSFLVASSAKGQSSRSTPDVPSYSIQFFLQDMPKQIGQICRSFFERRVPTVSGRTRA